MTTPIVKLSPSKTSSLKTSLQTKKTSTLATEHVALSLLGWVAHFEAASRELEQRKAAWNRLLESVGYFQHPWLFSNSSANAHPLAKR